MQNATPVDIHPHQVLGDMIPLSRVTYPIFNKYPKFIVDYQMREKERLRNEEQEYLRQRQQTLEFERLVEQRKYENEAHEQQKQLLISAEEQRQKMLELEEQKLFDQRKRLKAMKREARLMELKSLDEARRRYLVQQNSVREAEILRMDREIEKKVPFRVMLS
jgi:hypothetical protein